LCKKSEHFEKFEINMQILSGVTTKYHWSDQQKEKRNSYKVLVGNSKGGRLLGRSLHIQGEVLKWILRHKMGERGLLLFGSGCCEGGNELSGSHKICGIS